MHVYKSNYDKDNPKVSWDSIVMGGVFYYEDESYIKCDVTNGNSLLLPRYKGRGHAVYMAKEVMVMPAESIDINYRGPRERTTYIDYGTGWI